MPERKTIARSLSEIGLAAWFGGSLMGAIAVNGGAHVVGSVVLTGANKGRIAGQKNVAPALTGSLLVMDALMGDERQAA